MITRPQWLGQCKKIEVLDSYMSYYDSENNSSEVLLFLHGNATSSYLWRNIIPQLQSQTRCIALDLIAIGMGKSGKSGNMSYRFADHYKYFSAWLNLLNLPEKVVIVCHDWGSALAFHWCNLNSGRVKALVHMENVVDTITSWRDWPDIDADMETIKSNEGEEMKHNVFVETMLPLNIMRKLEPEEMEAYLKSFKKEGECRPPTLTWPWEIPLVNGGSEDVLKIIRDFKKFLKSTVDLPKLFIEADPGFFTNAVREGALEWPNTSVVKIKRLRFPQEDSADEIGNTITSFIGNFNNL